MKSDPIQFYRLISFIDPTLFTNETVFNQEYAKKIKIGHEKSASPEEIDTCIQLTNELVTLVDPIFIQRSSDLLSLPPKKEYTVFVPLSKTQCHLFNFYNQRAEIKRVSDSRLITTLPPFLVKIADTVKGDDYTSELQSLDFVGTLENGDRFDFKQFCRNVCKVDIDEMERKLDNQEGIDLDEGQNDDVEGSSAVKEIRESLVDIVNQSIDHSGDDDQSIFDDCCSESYKESQNLINDSYNKPTEDDINQSVSHPSVDDELQVNQSNNDFHQSDSSKSPPKPLTKEELFQALLDHSPKLKAIILLISDLINDNHSVLVFVQRLITIDVVLFLLQVLSIPAYSYEGCLSKKQRHKVLKHFIPSCNRHRPSVLVLTTACGSEGLTLVQADRVIIADIGLTPSEDIQAIGRVYRIGQQNEVVAYRIVSVAEEAHYARILKRTVNTSLDKCQSNLIDEDEISRIVVPVEHYDQAAMLERFIDRMPNDFENDLYVNKLLEYGPVGVVRHDHLVKIENQSNHNQNDEKVLNHTVTVEIGQETPLRRNGIELTPAVTKFRNINTPLSTVKVEGRLADFSLDRARGFLSDDDVYDDTDDDTDLDGFVCGDDDVEFVNSDDDMSFKKVEKKPKRRLIKLDLSDSDLDEDECQSNVIDDVIDVDDEKDDLGDKISNLGLS
ncbi:hypothetical protein P9112_014619 [Eukaryota sp. TZLM1-RC]